MSGTKRYRLIEQLPDLVPSEVTQTWLGVDLTLDRPITVRLTEIDSEPGQRLRLQTQSLAALEHPGLLHILDSYTEGRQFAIVTERLPQHTLTDELSSDGEFPQLTTAEALKAAATMAEALHVLHTAGFAHGGVSAAQVGRRREGGFILLTGPPTGDAVQIPATPKNDVRSLASLAHELLAGVPPEQKTDGTWRIASSVSPVIKPVLVRATSNRDPWPNAKALVGAFKDVARELKNQEEAAKTKTAKRRQTGARDGLRRIARRNHPRRREVVFVLLAAMVVGALAVVGGGAWLLARAINDGDEQLVTSDTGSVGSTDASGSANPSGPPDDTSSSSPTTSTGSAGSVDSSVVAPEVTRVPTEISHITDFDPFGNDTVEHPDLLSELNNGDPLTGWRTSRYNSPNFGGLKDGVGLLVELGGETLPDLARVVIESPSTGWTFQLFASNERRASLIEWGEPVAEMAVESNRVKPLALDFDSLRAATLLLWITDLGDELETGGYRVTVTGIRVSRYHTP